MNSSQYIRQQFIDFFIKNGHFHHKYSQLAPKDFDTTMFTIAGMKQFTDYFLGLKIPSFSRAVTCQPCLRVNDLENVGKTKRHHTFFEMLGNFSFGDYFKKEAIGFAFEFLINVLKLDLKYMFFTVFHEDLESYEIWSDKVGENKVIKIATDDNFWRAGPYGPCGPCTEIYFDTNMEVINDKEFVKTSIEKGEDRFLEIWNIVFMQYDQQKNGLVELPKKCVDTGMGLERICSVYDKMFDNYKTDLIKPIVDSLFADMNNMINSRVVADHLKAMVFLVGEGLEPSNEGQGYILRNLIRRSLLYVKNLQKYVSVTLECLNLYKEDLDYEDRIKSIIDKEEKDFEHTLKKALEILNKSDNIDEFLVFKMYDTYGLPLEITKNILENRNINIDWYKVEELKQEHAQTSKKKLSINFDIPTLQDSYDNFECEGRVLYIGKFDSDPIKQEECQFLDKGMCIIVTDKTCFYSRSGGQEGDQGIMLNDQCKLKVIDSIKQRLFSMSSYLVLHICIIEEGMINLNDSLKLIIDKDLRYARMRAHSAVHILGDVFEKYGHKTHSTFVDNDFFRIDIQTDENNLKNQAVIIEQEVKNIIKQNIGSIVLVKKFDDIEDAKFRFERSNYGDEVRIVDFPGVSRQLCGGTHVKKTGEIIDIKIQRECAVKTGIRRIEALVGLRVNECKTINQDKKEKIEKRLIIKQEFKIFDIDVLVIENFNNKESMVLVNKYNKFIFIFQDIEEGTKIYLNKVDKVIVDDIIKNFGMNGGGKDLIRLGSKIVLDTNKIIEMIKIFNH